jgi:prepilin-type N-terminal cleavage/methylation domain-containing protein
LGAIKKMINFKKKNGFTLIENLVALGIFAILMTISSLILFLALRGRAKALATRQVKEAGNSAIASMEDYLRRFASSPSVCSNGSEITITGIDGELTTLKCDSVVDRVASSSADLAYYLTPENMECSGFNVICSPQETGYARVDISFDLDLSADEVNMELLNAQGKTKQNFSTSIFMRGKRL